MLKKHPLVYELVDEFCKEHKRTVNNIIKLNTGIVYKRQPEYMILDERIWNVVKTYTKADFSTFFDNLNLILKYWLILIILFSSFRVQEINVLCFWAIVKQISYYETITINTAFFFINLALFIPKRFW